MPSSPAAESEPQAKKKATLADAFKNVERED